MKIKGRFNQSYLSKLKAVFLAAVVILLPIRIYQTLTIIEADTGFYTGSHFTIPLINILLLIFCVAFILTSFLSVSHLNFDRKEKSIGMALVSLATGIIFLANAFYETISVLSAKPIDIILLIKALIQFVIAGFFLWYCAVRYKGNSANAKPLLYLTPVLWIICRLLKIFMMATTFINVTPLLFELFALCFTMLFFFSMARATTQIDSQAITWRVVGFGLPASLFCFLYAIPQMISYCVKNALYSSSQMTVGIITLMIYFLIGLFITFYLFTLKDEKESH